MKYLYLLIFIGLILSTLPFSRVYSQTPKTNATSSATTQPLDESEMKNVKKIIDLVASSSAEQKLTAKVGVIGTVSVKTNTTLNMTTLNGTNKIIDIDEITKFSDPDSKTFGVSDIKKGETLGVIGVLNKVSSHILGRFIDRIGILPSHFDGVIVGIDRKNFQYTAMDENGNKMILDIQTSSKISSFTKDAGQIKAGFSKAEIGERVFASGFPDKNIANQLEIGRLILLPEVNLSSSMKKYVPQQITPSPSPKSTRVK